MESLKENKIELIVDKDFLSSYDLSIQTFNVKRTFGFATGVDERQVETVFDILDSNEFIEDLRRKEILVNMFLQQQKNKIFINVGNFVVSNDGHSIATKDFRILIDDLSNKASRQDMLYCCSVAALMVADVITYPVGSDLIKCVMKKYGYSSFTYQANGYIHIKIEKDLAFKTSPKLISRKKD